MLSSEMLLLLVVAVVVVAGVEATSESSVAAAAEGKKAMEGWVVAMISLAVDSVAVARIVLGVAVLGDKQFL